MYRRFLPFMSQSPVVFPSAHASVRHSGVSRQHNCRDAMTRVSSGGCAYDNTVASQAGLHSTAAGTSLHCFVVALLFAC